jgi:hypothetical protein
MACICGGIGEAIIIGGVISGVAWLWRKLRGHKHGDSCKH